VHLALAA